MEILINVIGYAGFIAVATYHKSPGEKFPDRWAPERRALVRLVRFTRSADQPVGLDQGMAAFSLRPQWKADHDEGKAKQQTDHHDAPVGRFVRVVKRRDHGLFSSCHPYRNRRCAQRDLGFNLTE
jgi:hypothetical protein